MTEPLLELQGAIVGRLKGDSPPIAGSRIYDRVPTEPQPTFPYVSLGPSDAISDDAECLTSYEVTLQLDVWSRAIGFPEVKTLAGQVRDALHGAELSLTDNALVSIEHRQTRILRDPDGLTSHAALTFTALIEQP
jgi:hypothetical protein